MPGFNKSTTNLTVEWQATPADLPTMYDPATEGGMNCTHQQSAGPNGANVTSWVQGPDWNEHLADTDSVCTIANASFVYPCCQAVGGEVRFNCHTTACRLPTDYRDQFYECAVKLAAQVNDSDVPLANCQSADTMNSNHARRRATVLPFVVVAILAGAALVA